MTHTTGPQDMPKANTYSLATTSATGPAAPLNRGWPSLSSGAVPKITASVPGVTAMPTGPISSSGRRPKRSIVAPRPRCVGVVGKARVDLEGDPPVTALSDLVHRAQQVAHRAHVMGGDQEHGLGGGDIEGGKAWSCSS